MRRGDTSACSDKREHQAEHIEHSETAQGRSKASAERVAWATLNKHDGDGRTSGSADNAASNVTHQAPGA